MLVPVYTHTYILYRWRFHFLVPPDALTCGALLTREGLPLPAVTISGDGRQCTWTRTLHVQANLPEHIPSISGFVGLAHQVAVPLP